MEHQLNPEDVVIEKKTIGTDGKTDPLGMLDDKIQYDPYEFYRR